MTPLERVEKYFQTLSFSLEIILFNESTRTSQLAAQALGVEVGQIAKTLVFVEKKSGKTGMSERDKNAAIIVTSGDVKVDTKKLKQAVGCKMRFADGEEVLSLTGYPPGGVCPFALPKGLNIMIDESMRRFPIVYAAAGTDNSAVPVTVDQLLELTGGESCDVCVTASVRK